MYSSSLDCLIGVSETSCGLAADRESGKRSAAILAVLAECFTEGGRYFRVLPTNFANVAKLIDRDEARCQLHGPLTRDNDMDVRGRALEFSGDEVPSDVAHTGGDEGLARHSVGYETGMSAWTCWRMGVPSAS